ncbi:hypothetical protein SASPL_113294 [Salvia splendens]|uniref:tRNA-guanine(15) transglycosylase-like domain-containing protein n=1 Tax=Salvia splendens TaxID=180675 RepID=A0A8X8ZY87_SALSN|nr:hypothetical protein SASPL_113294 [Salvia splendens]
MNFSVKALSKGGARAGVLQVGGCSMETPALLLSTRKGLPAFISPDLLSTLPTPDSRLLQFSPLHFVEGISLKVVSEMGGLHQMLGLKEHVFAANPADPILSVPDHQSSNKIGASFETPSGRFLIKPGQYIEMISSMKPDMWVTLSDEVPAWVTDKRNKASVQRTMRWLDDCLALDNTNDVCTKLTGGAVFGSIVGGSQINERIYCAQEVSRRNVSGVYGWLKIIFIKLLLLYYSGFHIGGFGLGESMDERPALLSAVTESLPEDKPRQISGLGLPEEVLQGVAAGIDLFNSTYIYHLTIGGFALIFTSEEIERHGSVDQLSDTVRDDGTKINLKATIYRLLFWSQDFLSNLTVFDICCMMKRLVDEWVQFAIPSSTGKTRDDVGEVFLFFVEHPAQDSLLLAMQHTTCYR